MVNKVRTLDFLPEVFRTPTNSQFLSASLDLLTSQPDLKRVEGFIGNKFGYGIEPNDKYVVEPTKSRSDYQLDPSVVFLKKDTQEARDFINYPGIIRALENEGAIVNNHDRLWSSDFYSWDSFVDLDKIVNYNQYYWIPNGPDAVNVVPVDIFFKQNYSPIINLDGFKYSNLPGNNPIITLLRGGTYVFTVEQASSFWIQGAPGVSGYGSQQNLSTRDILGVTNNGASIGEIVFTVPQKNAQSEYDIPGNLTVDLVTTLTYSEVTSTASPPKSIDGITQLNGKTLLFYNNDATGTNNSNFYTISQSVVGGAITLTPSINPIPLQQKITANSGVQWVGRQFFLTIDNSLPVITIIPYLSSIQDTLYYQDGNNPNGVGIIKLVENNDLNLIDIDDIIGSKNYISPNGVEFINGLKVRFGLKTTPASYIEQSYYIEGVGESITLLPVDDYIAYEESGESLYIPWDITLWDELGWSEITGVALTPDYLTVNRNSRDLNAWTRSNRWFNEQVIDATVKYNGELSTLAFNVATKAQRPIVEFQGNLHLWNSGTQCAGIVDLISWGDSDGSGGYTRGTNALKNVVGSAQYYTSNGVPITPGFKVLFPLDVNPQVRKTIYTVQFTPVESGEQTILLVPTVENIATGAQVYCKYGGVDAIIGVQAAGIALKLELLEWIQSQLKTEINQQPLYDIFDENGVSLGNPLVYYNTTFNGTPLFSYTPGTGANDPVLGFPVKYSSVTNIGDINFTVNLNTDTFTYTVSQLDTSDTITDPITDGFVHWAPRAGDVLKRNGWIEAAAPSFQYQVFNFTTSAPSTVEFVCDVPAIPQSTTPWSTSQVYIDDRLLDNTEYEILIDILAGTTMIVLQSSTPANTKVTVLLYSDVVSDSSYYQVPDNLQSNPFNTNIESVDLGDIRNHYRTIFGNTPGVSGRIFGSNNLYNLGPVAKYGTAIIQNSASLVLPGVFLRKPELNIFEALRFNSEQYVSYKQQLVDLTTKNDFSVYQTPAEMLDAVIYQISSNKNQSDSFYWSDMLPSGSAYRVNSYNFNVFLSTVSFTLGRIYDFTSSNYWGLGIYVTRTAGGRSITKQLVQGIDYELRTDAPGVTITYDIIPGDVFTVNEYNQTYGSYCPNTPTKLGLYKSTPPKVYLDNTYQTPTYFIVGHDGSYNKLYGEYDPVTQHLSDFRDQVLLEFELRVYNNLKIKSAIPLTLDDVIPGQFRETPYTYSEILQEYSTRFLSWIGANRIDYKQQQFDSTNLFTYNYNQTNNRQNGAQIEQGYWRGIYNWFYDTSNPANAPWEMLGFTSQPTWWTARYGAAPYTVDNLFMWQDIARGYVWNNGNSYIEPNRVRTGLLEVLPVDSSGNLIAPLDSVVDNYLATTFNRNWIVGDQGPAETSYLRSSSWPFDAMRILALTRPSDFFNLFVDRDLYKFDANMNQYLYDDRYHIDPRDVVVYGNGVSKASYINWVVDYVNQRGVDGTDIVTTTLRNIDVRLTYNLAGFSAKNYLKFLIEKSTPNTQNTSLLIPDNSYAVLLYDNPAAERITYSSVIVQRNERGWVVYGNSQEQNYFTTTIPKPGATDTITVNTATVKVSQGYYPKKQQIIPYGTQFYSLQGVSEFLINYGRYLTDQGVVFDYINGGIAYDWQQMVREFLYWAQQGWEVGSIISLNPDATQITVLKEGLVVQPLTVQQQNFILNQNLLPLQRQNAAVIRENSSFTVKVLSEGDTVAYTNLNLSSIEHAVVFDNNTVFNDTIYNLTTGLRQSRLLLSGYKTAEWNGFINASGFILNQDNVSEWAPNVKYAKGQIVTYKGQWWAARQLIEPSAEFFSELWVATEYDTIKAGLLPNPSTQAYESLYYYDSYRANLENDADLLSFSLIGYRPRQYLADADLSDITQINVYKNIIRSKGTNMIVNAFKNADLLQGQIDYDLKENWAVKTGDFGGTLNSNFVEFLVSQSQLRGNPALIGFSQDGSQVSGCQFTVQLKELVNYSRPPLSANFLPPYTGSYRWERGLPSAGYVNVNDAKFKTFELLDLNDSIDNIRNFYRGDVIWVANYKNSWDVFSPQTINTQLVEVINNLNGTCVFNFAMPHGLSKDDPFSVISFSDAIDGFYTVKSVNGLTSLTVDKILDPTVTVLAGTSGVFKLISRRFRQASDQGNRFIPDSQYYTRLSWVDNTDGTNQWTVWQDGPVFKDVDSEQPYTQRYGTSVAYSVEAGQIVTDAVGRVYRNGIDTGTTAGNGAQLVVKGDTVYISSPVNSQVFIYKVIAGEWVSDSIVTVSNTGAIAVGIDNGDTWLFAGNSSTNQISYGQVGGSFTAISGPVNSRFGESITVSQDGAKLFVGAPGATVSGLNNAGLVRCFSRISADLIYTGDKYSDTLQDGAEFGASVATNRYGAELLVGAPNYRLDIKNDNGEGTVYRFTNSGQHYGIVYGAITAPTATALTIWIDNVQYTVPAGVTAATFANFINSLINTNLVATANGDTYTITTRPGTIDTPWNIIDFVAIRNTLRTLGINLGINTQIITSPNPQTPAEFGRVMAIGEDDTVAISATKAAGQLETTFDFTDNLVSDDTIFDNGSTVFVDSFTNSGAVFEYDYLPAYNESVTNPGKWTLGQNIQVNAHNNRGAQTLLGASVAVNDGVIIVGAPGWTTTFGGNTGRAVKFVSDTGTPSWSINKQPLPMVDVNGLNSIQLYDIETNETLDYIDYIDPLQGKHLGAVETNVDIIGANDPARYTSGIIWGATQVGKTWLDTSNLRLLNYNQPSVGYDSSKWGVAFPGSTADIYTWVAYPQPPVNYVGPGYVVDFQNYTQSEVLNRSTNSLTPEYYFWVKNYTEIPPGKTLSPVTVSGYILDPLTSGIGFLAAVTTNVVALYNSQSSIDANSTVVHIGYGDTGVDSDQIHSNWGLVQENNADDFLNGLPVKPEDQPSGIYLKYLYSFAGQEPNGLSVPDPQLPPLARWGTLFRPRQSMFIDRVGALQNYIQYANRVLKEYPIVETRGLGFLENEKSITISSVNSQSQITVDTTNGVYVNQPIVFSGIPFGGIKTNVTYYIKSVVLSTITLSATKGGPILELTAGTGTMIGKLWNTRDYWKKTDWWAPGYSSNTKIVLEVPTYSDLVKLSSGASNITSSGYFVSVVNGLVARVAANRQHNSETWVYNNGTWTRIGLTNGTIELLDTIYTQPATGMPVQWIIRWLNEVVYTDEIKINRNRSLILMFNYIQSESLEQQNYLPWLNKTSLVDVSHKVRDLIQYKKFQRDNQEFLAGYLDEVKPYHVFIKDFSFIYDGIDFYDGNVTDFDLPAQYNSSVGNFESPQLVYQPSYDTNQYVMNLSGTGTISVSYNNATVLGKNTKFLTEITPGTTFIYNTDGELIGKIISVSSDTLMTLQSPSAVDIIDIAWQHTNPQWQLQENSQWFANYGLTLSGAEVESTIATVLTETLFPNVFTASVITTTGLPQTATVLIGTEQITYTNVDRLQHRLLGLIRGENGTSEVLHAAGSEVIISPTPVIILDQARGYTNPPRVVAVIDTNKFPYPRVEAELSAVLVGDKVVGVTTVNPGSGYAVQPQIRIDSSIVESFASSAIDTVTNTISIPGHHFITGDPVVYSRGVDTVSPSGLVDLEYYYVYVIDSSTVALYFNYRDADMANERIIPIGRVDLITNGSGVNHRLGVTAKAGCFTVSQPTREFTINLGFDRVSYASKITEWQASVNYASRYVALPGTVPPTIDIVYARSSIEDVTLTLNTAVSVLKTGQLNGLPITVTRGAESRTYYAGAMTATVIKLYTNQSLLYPVSPSEFSWYSTQSGSFGNISVPTPIYVDASLVTNGGRLWRCVSSNSDTVFTVTNWQQVTSTDELLTAADRVAAFYRPTASMPGKDLSQLSTGVEYPLATFQGPSFNYQALWDINAWDATGWDAPPNPSELYDTTLNGTATVTSIYDVNGGIFEEGYGPEELVPGVVVDSLNMYYGSGEVDQISFKVYRFRAEINAGVISFADRTLNPTALVLYDVSNPLTTDNRITQLGGSGGSNYTVDWVNKTITLAPGYPAVIDVVLYGYGGNGQIVTDNTEQYPFRTVNTGGTIHSEIWVDVRFEFVSPLKSGVFLNGQELINGVDYTVVSADPLDPDADTHISFTGTYDPLTNYASFVLVGPISTGYSIPVVQDQAGSSDPNHVYPLTGYFGGNNIKNAIVEIDGVRLIPSKSLDETYTKNTDLSYLIPTDVATTGNPFDPSKVKVYILTDGAYLEVLPDVTTWSMNWDTVTTTVTGLDDEFYVTPPTAASGYIDSGVTVDSSNNYVVFDPTYFATIPATQDVIKITYTASIQGPYAISIGSSARDASITFNGQGNLSGKVVSVTSFNVDDLQSVVTQSIVIQTVGESKFVIEQPLYTLTNPNKLWVSVVKASGGGYYIPSEYMSIAVSPVKNTLTVTLPAGYQLQPDDVIIITSTRQTLGTSDEGESAYFRLNVDKAGVSKIFNDNPNTRTVLTETTWSTGRMDDRLYVANAERLVEFGTYNDVAVVGNKITIPGVVTKKIITMIAISQGANQINFTSIKIVNNGGGKNLEIILATPTSGLVNVTLAYGSKAVVQSEQIGFREIVFDNKTTFTGTGYITGLTRGQNTTITNPVFLQDSVIRGVLEKNVMPQELYNTSWYNIAGAPLMDQTTPVAQFLNQWFP